MTDYFQEKDFKKFDDDHQYQEWRHGLEDGLNVHKPFHS
jgi:hypothetical protein